MRAREHHRLMALLSRAEGCHPVRATANARHDAPRHLRSTDPRCLIFTPEEENKFEYTIIHGEFQVRV